MQQARPLRVHALARCHSVKGPERLVDARRGRAQQRIQTAALVERDVLDEAGGLGLHRRHQRLLRRVEGGAGQLAQMQKLVEEGLQDRAAGGAVQQAFSVPAHHRRIVQLVLLSVGQKCGVGRGIGEQKRDLGRQLVLGQIDLAWFAIAKLGPKHVIR